MAAITDLITQATVSSRPTPSQASATRAPAGATLSTTALTGWPTGTAVFGCTYKVTTAGVKIAGSQIDFKAVVSGTQLVNFTVRAGTDVGNAIGDIVECAPIAAYANDLYQWGIAQHNQDGSHGAVTATSVTTSANVTVGGNLAVTGTLTGITPAKFQNPYKFRVYQTAAFSLTAGSFARIPFDTRSFDTSSNVDITTTKGRFTAPIAGFYQFNGHINIGAGSSTLVIPAIYKNGSEVSRGQDIRAAVASRGVSVHDMIQLAASDTVELQVFGDTAYGLDVSTPSTLNYFSGFLVSAT